MLSKRHVFVTNVVVSCDGGGQNHGERSKNQMAFYFSVVIVYDEFLMSSEPRM